MSPRLRAGVLALGLATSVLALACSKAATGTRMVRTEDASLTILATARTNGDTKPCG